jgi:uncharacterized protein YdaU (DUF1376 family)
VNPSPAFQFYPADYLADPNVDMMTLEQQGAYIRLICHAWRSTTVGRLLNDRSTLAALARMSVDQWSSNEASILRAFRIDDDGFITQKRLVKEWEKQQAKRNQAHEAGVKSGKVRRERPFNDRSTNRQRPVDVSFNTSSSSSIYNIYPKKVGKRAALKAITAAIKRKPADYILSRTADFAEATRSWPDSQKKYIPNPATWFGQDRFDDDPETWCRDNGTPNLPLEQPI